MKKELKVNEVEIVNGTPVVRGQFGDTAFEAAPFRWGSKMLMKVTGGDFDRGTRIAIGHAAKKALKTAEKVLPEAVLKRPRKAADPADLTVTVKVEAPVEPVLLDLVVDPSGAHEDLTALTVPQLKSRAKDRGLKGYSDLNKPQLLALLA